MGDSNYLSKREKEKGTDHEGQSPEMVLAIFALIAFRANASAALFCESGTHLIKNKSKFVESAKAFSK